VSGPIPPLPFFLPPPRRRGFPRDLLSPFGRERARTGLTARQASGAGELLAFFGTAVLHGDLATLDPSEPAECYRVRIFSRHINSLTEAEAKSTSNILTRALLSSILEVDIQPRGFKARKEKRMYSMWNAPSDLDYYGQFNPEPPEDDEPEPEDPEIPEELQAHWDAADDADRRYTMEAEAAGDDAEDDGIARRQPALATEPHLIDFTEVA
jgi:hypothetical protein